MATRPREDDTPLSDRNHHDFDSVEFSDQELEALLWEAEQEVACGTDEDAAPEPPRTPVTVLGDIWLLGRHRLLCNDATKLEAVANVLAGGMADMVFCDPPYNVAYEGKTAKKLKIDNDALGGDFYDFLRKSCANMLSMTKGAVYICMSSSELHTLYQAFTDAGGHWSTFVIWVKHTPTLGRSDYQRQYEPILYGWKEGTDHFWCGARDQRDVWFINRRMSNVEHPTMKPVELVEHAIHNSSKPRDVILDPFGGSGTTLIACEKWSRQARLIELNPVYCDVVITRWQDFTGNSAVLESTSTSFDSLKALRLPDRQ